MLCNTNILNLSGSSDFSAVLFPGMDESPTWCEMECKCDSNAWNFLRFKCQEVTVTSTLCVDVARGYLWELRYLKRNISTRFRLRPSINSHVVEHCDVRVASRLHEEFGDASLDLPLEFYLLFASRFSFSGRALEKIRRRFCNYFLRANGEEKSGTVEKSTPYSI